MAVKRRADLEEEILEVLHEFYLEAGYPPTYREVALRVSSAHSNVWHAVKNLRKGGFLRETPTTSARALLLSPLGLQRIGGTAVSPFYGTGGPLQASSSTDARNKSHLKPLKYTASRRKSTASPRSRTAQGLNPAIGGESS